MARRKVKVAKTKQESEAKWADEYFRQWQLAKEQLTQAEERLAEKQKDIDILHGMNAAKGGEINELRAHQTDLEHRLTQAKEQLADSEEQVRDLQEQLANCRAEYRADFELQEKTIADLRNEITKSYIRGMEQQQRCAVERIKQWVADNVAITGFDTIYTRLVNAVVWAVEWKAVDNSEPAD